MIGKYTLVNMQKYLQYNIDEKLLNNRDRESIKVEGYTHKRLCAQQELSPGRLQGHFREVLANQDQAFAIM